MISKKSSKADLERKRPLFFLTGLSLALIAIIYVVQWKTELNSAIITNDPGTTIYSAAETPVTYREMQKIPEKQVFKQNPDILNLIDDLTPDKVTLIDLPTIKDDGPIKEIGEELGPQEVIETINHIVVQKLAVPMECAELGTREEQMDCLNLWISRYVNSNLNLRKIKRGIFDSEAKSYVTFVISEKGEVESAEIIRESLPALDEEVKRIISEMPKFRPAGQMGRKVKMSMTIPVSVKFR